MLLSLLGKATSRKQAKQLFLLKHTNPGYTGTSLDDVLIALHKTGFVQASGWKFFRSFRLHEICTALLERSNACRLPTLLYFGIVHRRLGSTAKHFSVVTGVENNRLELLDPLGPHSNRGYNVLVVPNDSAPTGAQVVGCNYQVNQRVEAALLLRKD